MLDQVIAESAENIMSKAGLTPAAVLSLVYAEIARTGKIPVYVSNEDCSAAQLIALSASISTVKITDAKSANAFFEDDGGY